MKTKQFMNNDIQPTYVLQYKIENCIIFTFRNTDLRFPA